MKRFIILSVIVGLEFTVNFLIVSFLLMLFLERNPVLLLTVTFTVLKLILQVPHKQPSLCSVFTGEKYIII